MKIYIDEAGRGPLAGPLYCGFIITHGKNIKDNFHDSKQLKELEREKYYKKIINLGKNGYINYFSRKVSNNTIDKYGITKAINICIKNGILKLYKIIKYTNKGNFTTAIKELTSNYNLEEIIIDGHTDFGIGKDIKNTKITTIKKGDTYNNMLSAASIIAKVERDKFMKKLGKKFPEYKLEKNKGYGTKEHIDFIKKYGKSNVHRELFLKNY